LWGAGEWNVLLEGEADRLAALPQKELGEFQKVVYYRILGPANLALMAGRTWVEIASESDCCPSPTAQSVQQFLY
jgi:hypothetical protein